jgi:hypothetical protein
VPPRQDASDYPPGPLWSEVLWEACRESCRLRADGVAQPIVPGAGWDERVCLRNPSRSSRRSPPRRVHRRIVHEAWDFGRRLLRGRGITALFSGRSGTGKTMAAEVLADQLGLDLYRIDLAALVSKHMRRDGEEPPPLLGRSRTLRAILFFDEAEAVFGKWTKVKDAHDRYANIERDYLLQPMEDYGGIAILATNQRSLLDSAFLRRLRFLVEFPFPGCRGADAARARGVSAGGGAGGPRPRHSTSTRWRASGSPVARIRTIALTPPFSPRAAASRLGWSTSCARRSASTRSSIGSTTQGATRGQPNPHSHPETPTPRSREIPGNESIPVSVQRPLSGQLSAGMGSPRMLAWRTSVR